MKIVFALCLLGMAAACQQGGGGGGGSPTPAPVIDARCDHYRSQNNVTCQADGASHTCQTQINPETDDTVEGGPTPAGEYLLGRFIKNGATDWYKLHPWSVTENSFWYANEPNPDDGRNNMGLHPGTRTLGCVTVLNNVDGGDCWEDLKAVLARATERESTVKDGGFFYPTREVTTIGKMVVHL